MRSISAATALLLTASYISSVGAIAKITRSGKYLVDDSGSRFYIRGIAYQEQGAVVESDDNAFGEPSSFFDPLSNGDACARDLPYLQDLNINALRIYSVNSSLDHDACMKTFSDAGIYTILDLALPLNGSIDRTVPSWSTNIMDQYLRTIDTFSKYDNVLAVNVGNEVVTAEALSAAPFIKAAARDIKAYLASKSSDVLVGYAAIDGATDFRVPLAEFFSCDSDAVAIDLYGLNEYAWCGDSSYEASYAGIDSDYADYNVVAYFSEYGCILGVDGPRIWTEVAALFSEPMSDHWSGGVAFSYFPAASVQGQFGMVTISDDGSSVTTSEDYDNLRSQYGSISPPDSPTSGSDSYPSCPTTLDTSLTLPGTPDDASCNCVFEALPCQFSPATANYTVIVGELLNTACGLLGSSGGSCDDIGADGTTGTYGVLSGCDPTIKLSYAMSQYYELNNQDEQACSFAGNGTVNSASSSQASSIASSCIPSPSATFTPSSPPDLSVGGGETTSGASGPGETSGSSSSSGSDSGDGAVALVSDSRAVIGMVAVVAIGAVSGILTLI